MELVGGVGIGLIFAFELILRMVQLVIIASIVISWVGADPNNQIVRVIHSLSEPMLRPVRQYITRHIPGMIDWSPMVIFLICIVLQTGVLPRLRLMLQ